MRLDLLRKLTQTGDWEEKSGGKVRLELGGKVRLGTGRKSQTRSGRKSQIKTGGNFRLRLGRIVRLGLGEHQNGTGKKSKIGARSKLREKVSLWKKHQTGTGRKFII
jgi:hypothetical protein